MIDIKNVSKWYGSFQVLTDCTTAIQKGEVVVVCGPSGSGKSTLIKTVNALEPFQKGDIIVDGISIADPKTKDDALKIMAARTGSTPADYADFIGGTHFLTLADSAKVIAAKGPGFASLAGSSTVANDFNVKNAVYKTSQDVTTYFDAKLTAEAIAAAKK